MKIIAKTGNPDLATIYLAKTNSGNFIEFVESVQPPFPIEEKWILIVSTLFGCPVGCKFCDCSTHYNGKLSTSEILDQIDFMVSQRFPDRTIPVKKFKIQFARMGEPSFNNNVLTVLESINDFYQAPGFLPSLSTIAPAGCDSFFDELLQIKKQLYKSSFQLQFSIHSTNEKQRDEIVPVKKWGFSKISDYAQKFFDVGGKKISLNFALADNYEMNIDKLKNFFSPDIFLLKITPVNPTHKAKENKIRSLINKENYQNELIEELRNNGYETILSIGEWEENLIGSNCGQFLHNHLNSNNNITDGYTYPIDYVS